MLNKMATPFSASLLLCSLLTLFTNPFTRIQEHLDSFLGNGHYMETTVWFETSTGRIDAQTKTETITLFGGYTGGVQLLSN
jgi:hypothetical protein